MEALELRGLERLLTVCQRLALSLLTRPARATPPKAGTPISGHPLDPLLAAFYSRFGHASFAADVAGIIMARCDDTEDKLVKNNIWWREAWQQQLPLPLLIFAGEPLMACHYATVPSQASSCGLQPVVRADVHDVPFILPIASDVDHFFDTYSRFLEEAAATAEFKQDREIPLTFPWDVPHLLARDQRLVELLRSGPLASAMPRDDNTRQWVASILDTAARR